MGWQRRGREASRWHRIGQEADRSLTSLQQGRDIFTHLMAEWLQPEDSRFLAAQPARRNLSRQCQGRSLEGNRLSVRQSQQSSFCRTNNVTLQGQGLAEPGVCATVVTAYGRDIVQGHPCAAPTLGDMDAHSFLLTVLAGWHNLCSAKNCAQQRWPAPVL